jgi:hypothetical protein
MLTRGVLKVCIDCSARLRLCLSGGTNWIVHIFCISFLYSFDASLSVICVVGFTVPDAVRRVHSARYAFITSPADLIVLLLVYCCLQCGHLLLFCGVGPNSLWLSGMCELCLLYLISLFQVATSLILVWAPHTFRCFLMTYNWMGGSLCFSPAPNTHLLLW